MAKYVRETVAGKSISAYVIMKGSRRVATVQAHFSNGGTCLVNVWQESKAATKSAAAREKIGQPFKVKKYESASMFQHARATGYGYDKFGSALSGMIIDGHEMTDSCSRRGAPKPPKGRKTFPGDMKAPRGYHFANWADGSRKNHAGEPVYSGMAETECGYLDCYRDAGLKYLEAIGYTVIQAI